MNKVCLIKVTGRERHINPVHDAPALHFLDHSSKSLQPMKTLRRQADFLSKHFDKMPLTVAGLVGDFSR